MILEWANDTAFWRNEPIILVKNSGSSTERGGKKRYVSYNELIETRVSLSFLDVGSNKESKTYFDRSGSDMMAMLRFEEIVGLIQMLENGTLVEYLSERGDVESLSEFKVGVEIAYNRLGTSRFLFILNLLAGSLGFFLIMFVSMNNQRRLYSLSQGKKTKKIVGRVFCFLSFLMFASLLFLLLSYIIRWYLAGRIPLSNGYETMMFMALFSMFTSIVLRKRSEFVIPFGFLSSGFCLLVAFLGEMSPQITPLVPVLASPWLSIHVSLIMMSYSLFTFMVINSITALIKKEQRERLMLLGRMLLFPALYFLGAGIIFGSVWANVSWGSYWSWDPKEVWALIAFMVYGGVAHFSNPANPGKPLMFHFSIVIAYLIILMTYFGVNYFLGGMHSYAG